MAILALVHVSAFTDRALPSVLAPALKAEMALSDAAIGALQGPAFVAVYVLGLLVAGHWTARFNPWRVMVLCVLFWSVGVAVFALSTSYEGLVLGRIMLGAGQAALAPTALGLLGGQADPAARARSLSLFTAGSASGRSVALILGGLALTAFGGLGAFGVEPWRATSLFLAAPNLILVILLLRASAVRSPAVVTAAPGLVTALAAVRRRPGDYLSLAVAGAGCIFMVQAAGAWAPSILNRDFDLAPAQAALVFGAVVLVFAPLGHVTAGRLLARAGERRWTAPLMLAGLVVAAGCAALLPWSGLGVAVVLLAGLTLGGGLVASIAMIRLHAMTPATLRAPTSALFLVVTSLAGVGAGPWVTGGLSDAFAAGGQDLSRALAVTVCAVAVLVALATLARSHRWTLAEAAPA